MRADENSKDSAKAFHPSHETIAQFVGSPKAERTKAAAELAASRPVPALAFTDEPLAPNIVALILLGQPAPLERLIVVARQGFNDAVVDRAMAAARHWEDNHPLDVSAMRATLFEDDSYDSESRDSGREHVQLRMYRITNGDEDLMSPELLLQAAVTLPQQVNGVGTVRIVALQ